MAGSVEELSGRIFSSLVAAGDVAQIYIGDRLGFYRAIHEAGAVTSASLAKTTGTDERQVREWLEAQAVTGLLTAGDGDSPETRSFSLPAGYEEVLATPEAPANLAWAPRMFVGFFSMMPRILESFKTGKGVAWSEYAADTIEAQEAQNKTLFLSNIATSWFPTIPDVHGRLSRPGARIADIACGTGWSSIAFAEGYEHATVDGFDLDEYSIDLARKNAEIHGVSDRVRFDVADAANVEGTYDLVTIFEALHDMSHPVPALEAARKLAGSEGTVIIVDEKTEEAFAPNGSELERIFYTFSVLCCLPAGLSGGGVGTGTLMRPSDLERLAREAGFSGVEVLPIDTEMFRFYRLR
jgi:2-polyprenyl-3-methyl-5-hydroxy-6-metoxy-1,4-benzoquinol methylase